MLSQNKLNELAESLAESLELEFVASEILNKDNNLTLRIYLDKEGGVNLKDCSNFSKLYSKVLDVELDTEKKYFLEVSSPGSNRFLVKIEHFKKYVGSTIKVKLKKGLDGRRNFRGKLLEVSDDVIKMEVDGEVFNISFNDIEKANLVSDF